MWSAVLDHQAAMLKGQGCTGRVRFKVSGAQWPANARSPAKRPRLATSALLPQRAQPDYVARHKPRCGRSGGHASC